MTTTWRNYLPADVVVRCWWCDAEPASVHEITRLDSGYHEYLLNWPTDNCPHAAEPPTPGQLEQAGHEILMRIRTAA